MSRSVHRANAARAGAASVVTAAVSAAVVLTGCDGPSASPSPTLMPSASATMVAPPSWEADFDAAELEFYREAEQLAGAYEAKAQPIWAAGKATQAAKELFQDNLLTWRTAWARLEQLERQGIQIARAPRVLSSQAEGVTLLSDDAGEAKILRCVDATDLGGTVNGEPLQEGTTKPVRQHVTAARDTSGSWRFSDFITTDETCSA